MRAKSDLADAADLQAAALTGDRSEQRAESSPGPRSPTPQARLGLADWLVLGLVVGTAIVLVELPATRGQVGLRLLLATVGVVSAPVVVVVTLGVGCGRAAQALARRAGLGQLAARAGQLAASEAAASTLYALSISAVGSALAWWFGFRSVLVRLWSITDVAFAQSVGAVIAVVGTVGWLVTTLLASLIVRTLLIRLERRDKLVGAQHPFRVPALVVAVAGGTALVLLTRAYGRQLELLVVVPWVALLVLAQLVLAWPWLWLRRRWPRSTRWLGRGTLVASAVVTVAGLVMTQRSATTRQTLNRAPIPKMALHFLQAATDFDGDGVPWLLGGGDCRPFDPTISPVAVDVPQNGIDENCNGVDAEPRATRTGGALRGAPPPNVRARRYNVVWIVIDAMRPDRMSLYGHDTPTTPYLDSLAAESLVFDNAYSQATVTMLSVGSMLTGRDPGSIAWQKSRLDRVELADDNVTIAERLSGAGYRTAAVSDRYMISKMPGDLQGFETVFDSWLDGRRMPWFQRNAAVATSLGIRLIEEDPDVPHSKQPFFLLLYMADPHDPYDGHAEGFPYFGDDEMARYDSEVAFSDRYVGFLVDYLRYNRPLWDRTVLIVSADHGEEFGEHGADRHGFNCHVENAHVPLLVHIPRMKGRRVDERVGLIDVVPALLDVLGLDAGDMLLEGKSLLSTAFQPEQDDPERPFFCYAIPHYRLMHAVRAGDRGLFHDATAGTYGLYDLKNDPHETNDIASRPEESAVMAKLKAELDGAIQGNVSTVHE